MSRDSGRPCGCDPASDHPCEGHAKYRDESTTNLGSGVTVSGPWQAASPLSVIEINATGQGSFLLDRFEAEDLANEILRRLAPRAE